jgi:hypothetical protein
LHFVKHTLSTSLPCVISNPLYSWGMNTKQCPHCHTYKLRNVSGTWASMALLSLFFVVTIPFVPVFAVLSIATIGKYKCRQCEWTGRKEDLLTANA